MEDKNNTFQDNSFISEKKMNDKKNINEKTFKAKLYDYLIRKNNKSYIYSQPKNNELNLNKYYGKYYYLILINIDSDSKENNRLLKVTLDSICKNLPSLKKIGINSKDILILLFFQNISSTFIFQNEDFEKEYDINDYIYIELKTKYNDIEYDIIALTKNNTNKIIYNLKMFYNDIIRDIKKNEGFIYTSIIKCGIEIKENSLLNLFLTLNDIKNKGEISIPSIELNSYDLYSNIQKYEYLHFNIYDLNYYDKAYVIPINSYFNIMKINNSLLNAIQNFYMKEIKLNCSLYYHDYFMGIYLKNLLYEVNYISNISVYLNQDNIDYSQLMSNYVLKYSGYYANFFNLYNSFITSYNCDLFQKIVFLFQLIGMFFQFIFPSLSSMVIYSIFSECFNLNDDRTSIFFTIIYFYFLILFGLTYKGVNNIKTMKLISLVYFIFFEIYYFFILICSIIAINNINKNKTNDKYNFNKFAISIIIILNFIFGIIPMIISINKIISNIKYLFIYLIFGLPSSNSIFLMTSLFNCCSKSGGNKIEEKNGFFFIVFFMFNLLFEGLIFFNTNRSKRFNSVLILGIFFTIYNFFKQFSIILRLLIDERKYINLMHDNTKNILEIENKIKKIKEIGNKDNSNLQNKIENKNHKKEESFTNSISKDENNRKINEKNDIKENTINSNYEISKNKIEQKE